MTGPTRRVVRRVARGALTLLPLALVVAACGGDDSGSAYRPPKGPAQTTLAVTAGNFFFKPETLKGPAGIDKVALTGKGGIHTLVIEGVKDFKLRVDGDETTAAKVRFVPGDYTFFCDIPGHRDAGMEGTIHIT